MEKTVADLEPLTTGRPIEVHVASVEVLADPNLLHRVLANLISNALKASASDTKVTLRSVAEDSSSVRIEVEDEGRGLSSEDAARVFDPFWRSRGTVKAAQRGPGIGLTLVKEYVRSMGGDVGVRSELGVGSTFFFTLPLAYA